MTLNAQVHLVFSHISQPGNLGFAARLLGNFPIADFRLTGCCDHLAEEARRFSTHSLDILEQAVVYKDLPSALADCQLVIATTARPRKSFHPLYTLRYLPKLIQDAQLASATFKNIAIVFGNETSGLSNEELSLCNAFLNIPTDGERSSMNISHAVALVLYEYSLMDSSLIQPKLINNAEEYATVAEIEGFKQHWFKLLGRISFLHQIKEPSLRENVASILARAHLTKKDVRLLRAMVNKTLVRLNRLEKIPSHRSKSFP